MAKHVNKVILIGNVGQDPKVEYTGNGTAVARLSVATSEKYKDKQGEWQERTEWHNVTVWARLAEIVEEYVHKGDKIYIEGRNQTDKYEKDGQTHYMTKVIANDLVLLGGNGGGNGGGNRREDPDPEGFDQRRPARSGNGRGYQQQQRGGGGRPQQQQSRPSGRSSRPAQGDEFFGDELPA